MVDDVPKYIKDIPKEKWVEHTERCPVCGSMTRKDPIGMFFMKCFVCGWTGW